ncbi:MAG TPA: TlpA disulfide reductase family protein [Bryobacteraceae bacterium]|nr:TlpA disulfide reductase family protein [Bryobacteraceae bacterium]
MNLFTRGLLALVLSNAALYSQVAGQVDESAEEKALRQAIGEAGNSPTDFLRVIEQHLNRYPMTKQREPLELAAVKAALELRDNERILKYGERVLARDMSDVTLLERVARVLLSSDDKASAERALKYSSKLEESMREYTKDDPAKNRARAVMADELDRAIARAITYQARATGNLGKQSDAIALAQKAFDTFPSAEAAREVGRWLIKGGKEEGAIKWYALAFAVPDDKNSEIDRARDRAHLGEIYRKLKGNETGLGDLILQSYDRVSDIQLKRAASQRGTIPNMELTDPMQFVITGLNGEKLALSSLKGKVVIMDFWATWCGPCRGQYPLYEQVRKRFAGRDDVVFLAISTDEDRSVVKPFLEQNGWKKSVYFEDGLGVFFKVSSIPATVVIDRNGRVHSRMNGYIPERFVDMLTERINEALQVQALKASN